MNVRQSAGLKQPSQCHGFALGAKQEKGHRMRIWLKYALL